MVAIAAFNDSAHAEALVWNERALAMAERSKDPEGAALARLAAHQHGVELSTT
jgi:hypothetical protein